MIGLLLDALWAVFCLALGLGSVRVVGIALNARGRRRHARCLRNIERLEIANGFREAPRPKYAAYWDLPEMIEVKPGAPWPRFVPPRHTTTEEIRYINQARLAGSNLSMSALAAEAREATLNPLAMLSGQQQSATPYLDLFLEMRSGG